MTGWTTRCREHPGFAGSSCCCTGGRRAGGRGQRSPVSEPDPPAAGSPAGCRPTGFPLAAAPPAAANRLFQMDFALRYKEKKRKKSKPSYFCDNTPIDAFSICWQTACCSGFGHEENMVNMFQLDFKLHQSCWTSDAASTLIGAPGKDYQEALKKKEYLISNMSLHCCSKKKYSKDIYSVGSKGGIQYERNKNLLY